MTVFGPLKCDNGTTRMVGRREFRSIVAKGAPKVGTTLPFSTQERQGSNSAGDIVSGITGQLTLTSAAKAAIQFT